MGKEYWGYLPCHHVARRLSGPPFSQCQERNCSGTWAQDLLLETIACPLCDRTLYYEKSSVIQSQIGHTRFRRSHRPAPFAEE
jgi:hypothetical protein